MVVREVTRDQRFRLPFSNQFVLFLTRRGRGGGGGGGGGERKEGDDRKGGRGEREDVVAIYEVTATS